MVGIFLKKGKRIPTELTWEERNCIYNYKPESGVVKVRKVKQKVRVKRKT